MGWAVGILVSLAGAAVWSVLVIIGRLVVERSGDLAGSWYQVTYYSDDPGMQQIPWSVEFLRIKHHRLAVDGVIWRVHSPYFDRRWEFIGRYEGGLLEGAYWATRGDGGRGTLHLWRFSPGHMRGWLSESPLVHESGHMSISYNGAPIEWVRAGSTYEWRGLRWLAFDEVGDIGKYVPRRIVKLLKRQLAKFDSNEGSLEQRHILDHVIPDRSTIDSDGPVLMEKEKRRRSAAGDLDDDS